MTKAYLLGVLHDATERKYTYRIAQKSKTYIEFLADGIRSLGGNAWIYKEGKTRSVFIVEFAKSLIDSVEVKSKQDRIDYARGYFDTEGGIAKDSNVRYYLYFAQKNLMDLQQVKRYLEELGIKCGKVHNPSRKADPDYWRFYISAISYNDFAEIVGSWHPEKSHFLRMKR